jgi:hypothetical protein
LRNLYRYHVVTAEIAAEAATGRIKPVLLQSRQLETVLSRCVEDIWGKDWVLRSARLDPDQRPGLMLDLIIRNRACGLPGRNRYSVKLKGNTVGHRMYCTRRICRPKTQAAKNTRRCPKRTTGSCHPKLVLSQN